MDILQSEDCHHFLAESIREAYRSSHKGLNSRVTVDCELRLYWTKVLGRLTRPSVRVPDIGEGGKGLEFVDEWNRPKWMLQLIILTAIQIVVSGIVGWVQDSVDKGIVCLLVSVGLSQLAVSAMVLVVPPVTC